MPTATYIALANLTLSSNDAEVTFSSIPATYRDLVLVLDVSHTSNVADYNLHMRFNSDTGNNYSNVYMYGLGSGSGESTSSTNTFAIVGQVAKEDRGYTAPNIIQIQDYSATDKHKTVLARGNSAAYMVWASASRWANTSAVTSLTLTINTGPSFEAGSTFALYGIVS